MAKQQKPVTEEEAKVIALRKSLKRQTAGQIIAAILVLALVAGLLAYFAKGSAPKEAETTQPQTTAATAPTTPASNTPQAISKAEAAAILNQATAAAASKSYDWKRVCDYTPTGAIDVGSPKVKNVLNNIIDGIAKGATIDSVMGDFMGVGTLDGAVKNGQCAPKMEENKAFLLKGMSVTEADIQNYQVNGNTYEFDLAECVNPTTDGKNPVHHVTDDFITPESMTELVEGNSKGAIKMADSSKSRIYDLHVKAVIENGELKDLEFSYKLSAEPAALKVAILPITVEGKGEIMVTESYKNFA